MPSSPAPVEELDPLARSALLAAAARAAESRAPRPLFVDRFAAGAAGPEGLALLEAVGSKALTDAYAVKTRWFDDRVRQAIAAGARVVVIIGCGLDARPHRLALRPSPLFVSLDRREVIALRERLPRRARAFDVTADVVDATLGARIETAIEVGSGDRDAARVYVLEGLLAHLAPETARTLIATLAGGAPPGSTLLFDVPSARVLAQGRPYEDRLLEARLGLRLRFGCDDPLQMLPGANGTVVHVGHPEACYGRVPSTLRPADDALFLVSAECKRVSDEHPVVSAPVDAVDQVDVEYYDSDYPSHDDGQSWDEQAESLGLRDDVGRYRQLLEGSPGPILDLFCGTGRLTLPLARDGRSIVAVDVSAAMIERLERKRRSSPPEVADRIASVRADVRRLELGRADFAAAIMPFHSLNCLLDQGDQLAALRAAAKHLRPGGSLILDVVNPLTVDVRGDAAPRASARRIHVETGRAYVRFSLASPVDVHGVQRVEGWYLETDEQGHSERHPFRLGWRLVGIGELRLLLEAAGFEPMRLEGGFLGAEPTIAARRIVAVARKRAPA